MISIKKELDNQIFVNCGERDFNSSVRMGSFSASTSGMKQPKMKEPMEFLILQCPKKLQKETYKTFGNKREF